MGQRFGRYETLDIIGSGGMATVHLGRAVGEGGFERLVAIKAMHKHIADSKDGVASFLDEARLAALIRHPNVVSTIDVQKSDDGIFMVMEYVEGPSLATLMRVADASGEWPSREVLLRVLVDMLSGLQAAHDLTDTDGMPLQLVHRDVSPHNILVGDDGIARITDFGVARAEARLSASTEGKVKGKLAYMAPEHAYGSAMDRRADIYSAGVVLWELLTHERLFVAEQQGKLLALVLAGTSRSPRDVDETVPESIAEVCMRALAHDPNERYATAQQFADELEDACQRAEIALPSRRGLERFVRDFMKEQGIEPRAPQLHSGEQSSPAVAPSSRGSLASLSGEHEQADDVTMTAALATAAPPSDRAPSERAPSDPGARRGTERLGRGQQRANGRDPASVASASPLLASRRSRLIAGGAAMFAAGLFGWSLSPGRPAPVKVDAPQDPDVATSASAAATADPPPPSASTLASAEPLGSTLAPLPSVQQAPTEPVRATPKSSASALPKAGEPHGPSGFRPGDL